MQITKYFATFAYFYKLNNFDVYDGFIFKEWMLYDGKAINKM